MVAPGVRLESWRRPESAQFLASQDRGLYILRLVPEFHFIPRSKPVNPVPAKGKRPPAMAGCMRVRLAALVLAADRNSPRDRLLPLLGRASFQRQLQCHACHCTQQGLHVAGGDGPRLALVITRTRAC